MSSMIIAIEQASGSSNRPLSLPWQPVLIVTATLALHVIVDV